MTQPVYLKQPKTKLVAYLLWFFLGTWGAHRFYLKQYKTAIAYLVVTGVNFIATIGVVFSSMSDYSSYCDTSSYSGACASMSPYSMSGYGIVSAISWIVWIAWVIDAFLIPKLIREQNAAIYATYPNQGNGYGTPSYTTPTHMQYVQNQQPTYTPPVPQMYSPAPTAPQNYTQPTYTPPVVPETTQEPTENLSLDKPNSSLPKPPQLPPVE